MVHGDDFTILGWECQLDWFKETMNKRFENKHRGRIGPRPHDDKSIRILNRVVEWTDNGIEYEADQRHAEIIAKEMNLDENSRSLSTPGIKGSIRYEDEEKLTREEARRYRGMVARANYLGQGRSDIQYSVKELSRNMSNPSKTDWEKLKRLARYLVNKIRIVVTHQYQEMPSRITV